MTRRSSGLAPFVIWMLLAALAAPNSQAKAQVRSWDRPLAEARTAAAQGRHADAAALFARADALLGGYPYEEGAQLYGEDGRWVHEGTRGPIRGAFQCAWALEVLASPEPAQADEVASRAYEEALARAQNSCSPAEQARAAQLRGDDLQAALRVLDLPAAERATTLSIDARGWAESVRRGRFPMARDPADAVRFVTSHTRAAHGLDAECGQPFARAVHAPGADDPDLAEAEEAMYADEEEGEEAGDALPIQPFRTGTPDRIAFVSCSYSEAISPYEEPTMGPGSETVEYMLLQTTAGVQVVGWFRGMPQYECWTGVIQLELGHEVVRLDATHRLYTITRVEGYEDLGSGEAYSVRELVVCDPVRLGCRTLPLHASQTRVTYPDDPDDDTEPVQHRVAWRSPVSFTGGRVRLTQIRNAPASLTRFGGRGTTIESFLAAAPIDSWNLFAPPAAAAAAAATAPASTTAPPNATSATSTCPWRIADTDGSTNLRADASSRAAVVTSLANGTVVTVAERRGRWWRISAPSAGWLWAPNLAQRCP